jgi:predicted alpha/beta hydrolase family esterase
MRHIIILSGNSLKNKGWGELMLAEYGPRFDTAFMLEYDHWTSGEPNINFTAEEAKLATYVSSLPPFAEIVLFAKSAGSLLAFTAIHRGVLKPIKCIFFGIPFDMAAVSLFNDNWSAVDSFSIPAIAFHNTNDPTTSYEFTKDTLAEHSPAITLVTTEESDHWYGDTLTYNRTIIPFLAR